MYVTYSDLFTFIMVLVSVATFVCSHNGVHKKQRPALLRRTLSNVFLTIAGKGWTYHPFRLPKSNFIVIFTKNIFLFFIKLHLCVILSQQPKGREHTVSESLERVMLMYVTYGDLFAFVMVLLAVATFVCSHNDIHKKQRPRSDKVGRYSLCLIPPETDSSHYRFGYFMIVL